jgi:hypothetical protein
MHQLLPRGYVVSLEDIIRTNGRIPGTEVDLARKNKQQKGQKHINLSRSWLAHGVDCRGDRLLCLQLHVEQQEVRDVGCGATARGVSAQALW